MTTNKMNHENRTATRRARVAATLFAVACATLITGVGDAAERVSLAEYFTNLI